MRSNYEGGNYGYGHAKKEFMQLILDKYAVERKAFDFYMSNPEEIERKLSAGEAKQKLLEWLYCKKYERKLGVC